VVTKVITEFRNNLVGHRNHTALSLTMICMFLGGLFVILPIPMQTGVNNLLRC